MDVKNQFNVPHIVNGYIYDKGLRSVYKIVDIKRQVIFDAKDTWFNDNDVVFQLHLDGRCSTSWYTNKELSTHYPYLGDGEILKVLYGRKKSTI